MSRRLRGASGYTRNPSIRWVRLVLNASWLLAAIALCLAGVLSNSTGAPLIVNQAFSRGVQDITFNHLTPGPALEWLALASILGSLRWLILEFRAVFGGGPIEVRPLDNASGTNVETHPLDLAFREFLTLPRLYRVATVPGDPEPEHLIEALKAPAVPGWRGLVIAALSYAFPRRAFIVTASLRKQSHKPMYGVAVQVRRLPGHTTELKTQWSSSFERALQRAAYAVAAHILPQTRACRYAPWSAWRRRILPASLFRDYQRAKQMTAERRYDEALSLYHDAHIKDANNIHLEYDVGQLYERLGLYTDALYIYLNLVNDLHPAKRQRSRANVARRSGIRGRNAFVIWYRYVVVLGMGAPLGRELLNPDWEELRDWLAMGDHGQMRRKAEERPLRVWELQEMRRLLAKLLSERYPGPTGKEGLGALTLPDLLQHPESDENLEVRLRTLERCLLKCAKAEVQRLAHTVKWSVGHHTWGRRSSITLTAVRQLLVGIQWRSAQLDRAEAENSDQEWTSSLEGVTKELRRVGYQSSKSVNWLEHYNAACIYALIMREDRSEVPGHLPYAYAAVSALDLALKYGEDVDFIRTKRYWLQAGDPDLSGLRSYSCFRAFEGRVYGRPLPATTNIAKYELYLHLRAIVEDGARHIEREWRNRAARDPSEVSHSEFESWWRREKHAWELAIRLGRFYRQWQTRVDAVEGRREWIEAFGHEARPVAYPSFRYADYEPSTDDFKVIRDALAATEAMFHYLGYNCGDLLPTGEADDSRIMTKTSAWSKYAIKCGFSIPQAGILSDEVVEACEKRAAVWAALRHWARVPSDEHGANFVETVRRLDPPPDSM
jgi:hypothetical protein